SDPSGGTSVYSTPIEAGGTGTATIGLLAGETVTCTFTNEKDAFIKVIKQTDPDGDPQSFEFNPSWPEANFFLKDNDPAHDSGDLDPATYTVDETLPSGWDFEGVTCTVTGGSGSTWSPIDDEAVQVVLKAGETVTCTFTNEKDAFIKTIKVTDPDGDPQLFTFDPSWSGSNFDLKDNDPAHDSGDLDPATYTVDEILPSGWDFEGVTCTVTGGSGSTWSQQSGETVEVVLKAGETVTCTFTNEKDAFIKVVKQTDPDGDPQSFEFNPSWAANFFLTDGQTHDSGDLDPGTYDVSEIVPAGWDLETATCTDGAPASMSLQAGETITCTFTNEKDAFIKVVKQTDPDGDTTEFEFDPSWAANFFLSDGETETSGDLDPGTYDVSEIVPAGWDLDSVVCTSSNGDSETNTAISLQAISLQAGETVTCTFTNEKRGTVIVEKYTTGGDGSFTFELLGVGTLTFSTGAGYGTGTFSNVVPGTYSVTEQVPPGWTLFSATCSAGTPASFTVAPGQTVTCTFKNIRSGLVTTSALCTFDRNPNQAGQQFRLILTQDPTAQSTYKVTATNPGQFFFNIFVEGSGSLTVTATLPYPFVTKGAVPIHVYDSVSVTTVDGKSCLVPGTLIATSSQSVSLGSYSGTFGITVDVPISFTSSGFAYIAIHMDYGLKGTVGWTKGTSNEAIGSGAYSGVTILDLATYTFSFAVTAGSSTTSPGSATIQNENTFKHDPGFAGLVLTASDGTPVEGVTVKIYKPNGQPLATLTTDVDGFYFYNYKHTGKPATFKIVCSGQPVYVLVKANAFVWVNFYI
ncbi:MAG TPA: hypothetical protein VJ400_06335, partial [Thermoplasmata archaeon]|nr:hypothetical protein [Thermoplasmata archaeon]